MTKLSSLKNTTRPYKRKRLLGRGPGSGSGKTSGRGEKGAGSRSGYRRRLGYEGGQMRLHMKLPKRGFSNVRFKKRIVPINLFHIEQFFSDGDVVNAESLRNCGLIGRKDDGFKVLSEGKLTKKVTIEADHISAGAREKLQKANITFKSVRD